MKPRIGSVFTVRALNAVQSVLSGWTIDDLDRSLAQRAFNAMHQDEFDMLSQRAVKDALLTEAHGQGLSIRQLLRRQKNCGVKTVDEILKWIGLDEPPPGHVCVCRHCGCTMTPKAT